MTSHGPPDKMQVKGSTNLSERTESKPRVTLNRVLWNPSFPLFIVAAVALVVHLPNLLYYPAWFFDEGAYLTFSAQWQQTGRLEYYGHPFGALAILYVLFAVVNPSDYLVPRIMMAAFSAIDAVLLYRIAKAIYSRGESFPFVASLIYAATPLSARYLRLVVVDNFMAFFLLLSLFVIVTRPKDMIVSALLFGGAVVSKQTALFFVAAFLFLFLHQKRRLTYSILWLAVASIIPMIWVLYGVYQIGLSGLIDSQLALTALGGEKAIYAGALIIQRISTRDPFIWVGIAGILWAFVRRDWIVAFPISYLAAFVVLFVKISTVYLIPALPFFSLLATALLFDTVKRLPKLAFILRLRMVLFGVLILGLVISSLFLVVPQNPAAAQSSAISYVGNLGSPTVIVSYTYLWLFKQSYPKVIAYDRYFVPWSQLSGITLYMIVDHPGDLLTIESIPQYNELYSQSVIERSYQSSGYVVEVRRVSLPS